MLSYPSVYRSLIYIVDVRLDGVGGRREQVRKAVESD